MPANFQRRVVSNSSTIRPSTPRSILQELLEEDSTPYKGPSRAPSESSRAPSPSRSEADTREHAIVSQLLAKVRELEEANSQITHNQRETSARLQAAKVEAETIRRVYEYFDENPDIDLELDEGTQASAEPTPTLDNFVFPSPGKDIIRFGSLRRTIDGDVRRMAFENGIRPDRHSTSHAVKPSKRKTIVGLFDSPERSSRSGSSTAFTTLEEIQPIKSLGEGPLSPISSLLSPDDDKVYLPTTGHPTLGSELGSELGDVFNSGGADHFHTSSIYGLESFSVNSSSPPSPRGSIMHRAGEDPRETPMLFPSRPADEPETPQTGTRMRKLSATVRARTSRWVDHRLHDFQSMRMTPETPTPAPAVAETSFESSALVVQPHPALHAIDRVFDAVDAAVERITPLISPARRESPAPDAAALVDSTSVATIVPEERPVTKRRTLSAMMLEAWLWAQFLVIVLVFVYAMAKRGPKSILKDADRKRGRVL